MIIQSRWKNTYKGGPMFCQCSKERWYLERDLEKFYRGEIF